MLSDWTCCTEDREHIVFDGHNKVVRRTREEDKTTTGVDTGRERTGGYSCDKLSVQCSCMGHEA